MAEANTFLYMIILNTNGLIPCKYMKASNSSCAYIQDTLLRQN